MMRTHPPTLADRARKMRGRLVTLPHKMVFRARARAWRVHPLFRAGPEVTIDRPIFLLGTQGGGLTLVSRILQRHPDVVTATGGSRYWAGADEAHNVLGDALPETMRWRHGEAGLADHNGLFATDRLLPLYARGEPEVDPETAAAYRRIVSGLLRMHGARPDRPRRFLDKSQTNSVKAGYLAGLLEGADPRFACLIRNPFVMVWRAATGGRVLSALPLSQEEKVDLAIEHWSNLFRAVLVEEGRESLAIWRYEDVLAAPEARLREICAHLGLDFRPEIMPGPDDRIPLGSAKDARDGHKWYPIRPANNARHLEALPNWARARIAAGCADLIERFGYESRP